MIDFYKILILLTSLLINTVFAQQNKILIVNSDNTVQRYGKIAAEFKTILQRSTYKILEFNLETHSDPETDLKKFIQEENPNIIYCIGTKAYSMSRVYAKEKILIFSAAINWRRLGVSDNTYGIANELSPEQEMSLLRLVFPHIKTIGLLYNNDFNHEYVESVKKDAKTLNIQIVEQQINQVDEIDSALEAILPKIDMFWVISDPVVLENKATVEKIFQAAKQQNKPVYAYSDIFIKYGAVLATSADTGTIGRQSATLLMSLKDSRIVAGTVQPPAGSNMTLNECVIQSLGMSYSKDASDSINNIIPCTKE